MKKALKAIFVIGGFAAAGYFSLKIVRVVKVMNLLEKSLPEYLESLCDECPEVKGIVQVSGTIRLTVRVKLSEACLAKFPDLQETVMDYIEANYPSLMKHRIKVKVVGPETEDHETFTSGAHYTDPEEG